MSNAIAIISGAIAECRDEFARVSVDRTMNFERECGFAIQVLQNNDYALSVAMQNKQSVINAVTNLGALGLSLNPARKQAYLVPRDKRICLDISYMGLRDIAVDSGSVMLAQAQLVRANDIFQRNGIDQQPTHTFNEFATEKERGEIIGVYVTAKLHNGDWITDTMTLEECHSIRDRSEGWKAYAAKKIKSTPWASDEGEMLKKTVIKRAYKGWPKTDRMDAAIADLNANGEGIAPDRPADWVDVNDLIAAALQTKTDADALAYWRANNARLVKQPADHKRLKDAIASHRAALVAAKQAADDARTVDMEPAQTEAPQAPTGGVDPDPDIPF